MTRALDRRALRLHGIVTDLLARSKRTIWCYDPEHMPAMIDLLIAQGTLRESDRPHCVHWTAIRGEGGATRDDLGRTLDADEMLDKAGIRTLTGQQGEAWRQGPEALRALYREWFGELSADTLERLAALEVNAEPRRIRRWNSASRCGPSGWIDQDTSWPGWGALS
jgi:hypothetical protein